jgi:hypothetical protein
LRFGGGYVKKGDSMQTENEFFYDFFPSALGPLWMVSNQKGLCFILRKESEPAFLAEVAACSGVIPRRDSTRFGRWRQLFTRYFSDRPPRRLSRRLHRRNRDQKETAGDRRGADSGPPLIACSEGKGFKAMHHNKSYKRRNGWPIFMK